MTWLQTAVDGEYSEQTGGNRAIKIFAIVRLWTLKPSPGDLKMKLPIQFPTCLRTLAVRIEGGLKRSVEMEKVYICILWQNKTTSWWMMRDVRLRNEQSGTHHFNVVNGWKTPHKNIDVNKCSSIWNMPWFRNESPGRSGDRLFLSTGLCWG